MGNWAPTRKLDPIKFDGDTIIITAKPLRRETVLRIAGDMQPDAEGKVVMTVGESLELCDIMQEIAGEYLVDVDGMTTADGDVVTCAQFVDMLGDFYFTELATTLLQRLMDISQLKESEVKKSAKASVVKSKESVEDRVM